MDRFLKFEELEERIAPTVIAAGESLTFTDDDGDEVKVSYDGPAGSEANLVDDIGGDINPDDSGVIIGTISVTNSDFSSVLRVENLGGGDDHTEIANGVDYVTAGAGTGLIALGVAVDGSAAGAIDLDVSAMITSQGRIDTLLLNGDFDADSGGHRITSVDDIGLVEIRGDMALVNNIGWEAGIIAGATGVKDVSFIHVTGDITEGTGGGLLAPTAIGAGITINDDMNLGGTATLRVSLSGGATGSVTAIPMLGGGSVIARIDISGDGALSVVSSGGGDVTSINSDATLSSATFTGAADTDVYSISAVAVGAVANRTVGGDIVAVESAAGITSITTGARGNLGVSLTGAGNHYPAVIGGVNLLAGATTAVGAIGSIAVGGIENTGVYADSIGSLKAAAGGISGSDVSTTSAIGTVQAAYIADSVIHGQAGITSVTVGSGGISGSEISANGNISLVKTTGSITGSVINAEYEDIPGHVTGGAILSLQAVGVYDSAVAALTGFGSVKVTGSVMSSAFTSSFLPDGEISRVGGPIMAFSAGGISGGSDIEAVYIGSLAVGVGGINDSSTINADGLINKLTVKGDVTDDTVINAGVGIGAVTIGGDLAYDARVGSSGYLTSLTVKGQIMGGDVIVNGNVGSIAAKGGINGLGTTIGIGGDVLSLTVGGSIAGQDLIQAGRDDSTINIEVDGGIGKFAVAGGISSANIAVGGAIGAFSVGGTLDKGTLILEGAIGTFAVKGDVNYSGVTIGQVGTPVTVGLLSVGGGISSSSITADGDVTILKVKGSAVSTGIDVTGDAGAMSFGRGVYGSFIRSQGHTGAFTAGTAVHTSQTLFYGGVDTYTVKGSLYYANVGTISYDGGGNPSGGAIGTLTVGDINGTSIFAFDGISKIVASGVIFGASIEAAGRDDSGLGDIVDGAAIGSISAKGLSSSSIIAYTDIGAMTIGVGGVDAGSAIETTTGNLGSIATSGLIFGQIDVAGNVTGSILSAGTDAAALGTSVDYYFCDANGVLSGGTLTAGGTIAGPVS